MGLSPHLGQGVGQKHLGQARVKKAIFFLLTFLLNGRLLNVNYHNNPPPPFRHRPHLPNANENCPSK